MHPSDEGTPTPGRPSQQPPHQHGDPGWPRVVGGLDRIDSAVEPLSNPSKFPWALCGALLLAVCAGAMLLSGQEGEKQIIRAGTETVMTEPPALPEEDFQDPALAEAPAPVMVRQPAQTEAAPPAVKRVDLKVREAVRAKRPVAKAKKPVAKKKVKALPPPKKIPAIQKIDAMSQADKDVALLAAVVTRTKAAQEQPSIMAAKWKQCATAKSVAAAKHCREQLCAGRASGLAECSNGTIKLR